MQERLLASSKKLEKGASAVTNAKQDDSYLRIKLQASKKKYEGLPTARPVVKRALGNHVAMTNKKTALTDTARSKLQDQLSRLRASFESYQREPKKKSDDTTICYNKSQTSLHKSEKERVHYYVEKAAAGFSSRWSAN